MLVTLIALAAQGASSAPATLATDARCLAAYSVLADDKDKDVAEAGIKGIFYFSGKLHGRDPQADLGAALKVAAVEVADRLEAETVRCTAEIEALGKALDAAGDGL